MPAEGNNAVSFLRVVSHGLVGGFFVFVFPASDHYGLHDFGFGSGGQASMNSSSYSMEAVVGETEVGVFDGSNYAVGGGLSFVRQASVPLAPNFENHGDYYDQLRLIINPTDNPSDTLFAVAISDDDWVTTRYVQNDMTVGDTLGIEDYRTYASWGGISGNSVIGLSPDTTYRVKVKAMQGDFTETGYGPEASAETSLPKLAFDIDVSATDTETEPPFVVDFGELIAGTVTSSPVRIWVDFSTNGNSGGKIFVSGKNGGLSSPSIGEVITSSSGDLSILASGYGAQGVSATEGGGGPFTINNLYEQAGDIVGTVDALSREIFSADASVSAGRASFLLKAKSSSVTPAARDYSDMITLISSANF